MAPTHKDEYTFKVIMLGDHNVGKTSLLLRCTENLYKSEITATVTAASSVYSVEVDPDVCVTLKIWDTSGQEKYKALTRNYYNNTAGCLLVFDLTNPKSFINIETWYEEICDKKRSNKIVFVLVGQKCDDLDNRKVNQEVAEELAKAKGMPYVETSALTGHSVREVFNDLARRIKNEGILADVVSDNDIVDIAHPQTSEKKNQCCS